MFLSPLEIVKALPLPTKPKVGDFGTGAGQYILALGKRLGPGGALYALDAFPHALDRVRREAQTLQISLYALHADINEHIPLRTNLLNAAVVANILSQLSNRQRFLGELSRVMEPGSQALVVEWAGSFKNMGPPEASVLTPAEAVRLFQSAGFSTGEMLPAGTHHFAFVATNHTA